MRDTDYSTFQDVMEAVATMIEAGDAVREEYDIEKIARAAYTYSPRRGKFTPMVDEEDFWWIVERCAL